MFPNLNPMELLVVFGVAVLLFGKKLPEVSRSLGKQLLEFKKSFRGIEDEFRSISQTTRSHMSSYSTLDETPDTNLGRQTPTTPKFEPPTKSPVPRMEAEPQPYQD